MLGCSYGLLMLGTIKYALSIIKLEKHEAYHFFRRSTSTPVCVLEKCEAHRFFRISTSLPVCLRQKIFGVSESNTHIYGSLFRSLECWLLRSSFSRLHKIFGVTGSNTHIYGSLFRSLECWLLRNSFRRLHFCASKIFWNEKHVSFTIECSTIEWNRKFFIHSQLWCAFERRCRRSYKWRFIFSDASSNHFWSGADHRDLLNPPYFYGYICRFDAQTGSLLRHEWSPTREFRSVTVIRENTKRVLESQE